MDEQERQAIIGRIDARKRELNISDNALSLKAGLTREYWRQTRDRPGRFPTINNFAAICDAVGIRPSFALSGTGPRLTSDKDGAADVLNVPHISWVAASPFADVPTIEPHEIEQHLALADLPHGNYIALSVQGNSMDRIAPNGSIIIVNRWDTELVSRRFYVFALQGRTTFKRWIAGVGEPGRLEPYSTDAGHDTIFPSDGMNVVGRVVRVITEI